MPHRRDDSQRPDSATSIDAGHAPFPTEGQYIEPVGTAHAAVPSAGSRESVSSSRGECFQHAHGDLHGVGARQHRAQRRYRIVGDGDDAQDDRLRIVCNYDCARL